MTDEEWAEWQDHVHQKPWRDLTTEQRKARWRAQYGDHTPGAHSSHPRAAYPMACEFCYGERIQDIEAGRITPISADDE